jgi:hypothetical protein
MTKLLEPCASSNLRIAVDHITNLSSQPERTRISYFAELTTTTDAALRKESRRNFINATELDRKSGGAEWRDLQLFSPPRRIRCKRYNPVIGSDV